MTKAPPPDPLDDLAARCRHEAARHRRRRPKRIADVMARLVHQRGYGRVEGNEQLESVWRAAVGERLAPYCQACRIHRGKLEIIVANSTVVQELTFEKAQILRKLQQELPTADICDLRLRVGRLA